MDLERDYPNLNAIVDATPGLREWVNNNHHPLGGKVFRGRYEAELRLAFAAVKNPENWKMPVDVVLPQALTQAERALVIDAVGYYAGGMADAHLIQGGTRVTFPGYYEIIGA